MTPHKTAFIVTLTFTLAIVALLVMTHDPNQETLETIGKNLIHGLTYNR